MHAPEPNLKKIDERKKRHLHLHVISSDLTASALKTKRHYNTFSPRVGFFIPLTKVRAWFEDTNEKNKVDSSDDGDQQQQQLLVRVRFSFLRFYCVSSFFFLGFVPRLDGDAPRAGKV